MSWEVFSRWIRWDRLHAPFCNVGFSSIGVLSRLEGRQDSANHSMMDHEPIIIALIPIVFVDPIHDGHFRRESPQITSVHNCLAPLFSRSRSKSRPATSTTGAHEVHFIHSCLKTSYFRPSTTVS